MLITVGTDFLRYGFRSRLPRHWANGDGGVAVLPSSDE